MSEAPRQKPGLAYPVQSDTEMHSPSRLLRGSGRVCRRSQVFAAGARERRVDRGWERRVSLSIIYILLWWAKTSVERDIWQL